MMNFLKDWIIQYQNKFSVGGVETTIDRITGTVSQEGDTIMASYLNEIQKNCIYQVSATRVIEGVLEIYDISINGSEDFTPFNQTFLIDFNATNTQVDSLLRFNGITYSLRFSDSVTNGDKAPAIGFIPKRAVVKLNVSNLKAIIINDRTIIQSLLDLKANLSSPALTGEPTAPTPNYNDNSTRVATTAFVNYNPTTVKAWVNFSGQGTPTIRTSHNVSSINDNGVGSYGINFYRAMADTNYSYTFGLRGDSDADAFIYSAFVRYSDVKSINTLNFRTKYAVNGNTFGFSDLPEVNVQIFGN